jgi:hypothetical protein
MQGSTKSEEEETQGAHCAPMNSMLTCEYITPATSLSQTLCRCELPELSPTYVFRDCASVSPLHADFYCTML